MNKRIREGQGKYKVGSYEYEGLFKDNVFVEGNLKKENVNFIGKFDEYGGDVDICRADGLILKGRWGQHFNILRIDTLIPPYYTWERLSYTLNNPRF